MEIGFDNFESECPKIRTFLSYIIALMNDIGIIRSPKDRISVEVFEQENGDMIIYISSFPAQGRNSERYDEYDFITDNPQELFEFANNSATDTNEAILHPELYFYAGLYHLFFKSSLSKKNLNKLFSTNKISKITTQKSAKIKEYSTFSCNAPFDKLI